MQEYLLGFLGNMGCWTVGGTGGMAATLADPVTRPAALQAAAKLGAEIVLAISSRTTYPEQRAQQPAFAQQMRQLVSARAEDWTYEADYWRSQGRS